MPPDVGQGVRPGVQQRADDLGVPATGGEVQWLPVRIVDGEKAGIVREHRANRLGISIVRRLQNRPSVSVHFRRSTHGLVDES